MGFSQAKRDGGRAHGHGRAPERCFSFASLLRVSCGCEQGSRGLRREKRKQRREGHFKQGRGDWRTIFGSKQRFAGAVGAEMGFRVPARALRLRGCGWRASRYRFPFSFLPALPCSPLARSVWVCQRLARRVLLCLRALILI
jgi:hypothetical protein